MSDFQTARIPKERTHVAPDGSDVRVLLSVAKGGLAQFELAPGQTSMAVMHKTVDEMWVFISGRGEMWRRKGGHEQTVSVESEVCVTIPAGTHFQFRSTGSEALKAIGVTIPPWPGKEEASAVKGKWRPTVPLGGF